MFDRTARRLYVQSPLTRGCEVTLIDNQAHYVLNVLRHSLGDILHIFNGFDGEWRCSLARSNKKTAIYVCEEQLRPQPALSQLHLLRNSGGNVGGFI
jgi:16S rRNA (uracil1498-N3)-methyltransferase